MHFYLMDDSSVNYRERFAVDSYELAEEKMCNYSGYYIAEEREFGSQEEADDYCRKYNTYEGEPNVHCTCCASGCNMTAFDYNHWNGECTYAGEGEESTKTYSFDKATKTLTVYSNKGVYDFCSDIGAAIEDFNYPTIIDASVTDCTFMFEHCKSFNQPISIPDSVTICRNMFTQCRSFNQPVTIPNSVTDCFGVFRDCESFNQPIILPNSATDCSGMFYGCKSFNQPITIPDSVTDCSWMFTGSESLNKPITIPNSVSKRDGMLLFCSLMNEDGTPKSSTGSYTLSSMQHDVPTLMKVMEKHLNDYVDWFNAKFPNGTSSAEEVLTKLKEE